MNQQSDRNARRVFCAARISLGVALAAMLLPAAGARAQDHAQAATVDKAGEGRSAESKPAETRPPDVRQTFFLSNVTSQNDLGDIQTDLRNMITRAKVYGVVSQNAISVAGTAEEIQLAQKMISELDRPKKVYRLTYTITETDNGSPAGTRHFSLIVPSGGKTELTQGTKVPIVTGTTDAEKGTTNSQVQYLDVGLKIQATLDGVRLHTKVEQSSLAEEKSGMGGQDPIVRQTVLDEMSTLSQGKPMTLGSLDIPGTSRREEIGVAAELLP
jgi:type II secretory pathway component GspD/PulD (secretin)